MIYAVIYRTSLGAAEHQCYLLRRRKTRGPMKVRLSCDTIEDRRSIHDHPVEIEDGGETCHREADLVI